MKKNDWFKYFDEHCEKFHWVFTQHGLEDEWDELMGNRDVERRYHMELILLNVYFAIPEETFTINSQGYKEFINLVKE